MEDVTTSVSGEVLDLVERLAEVNGEGRSDAIRRAIRRGAREELLRVAFERYREGDVGIRGAADLAGLSITRAMAEASERGVRSNYDEADLADDVDALR